jgi:hypothetical protein
MPDLLICRKEHAPHVLALVQLSAEKN